MCFPSNDDSIDIVELRHYSNPKYSAALLKCWRKLFRLQIKSRTVIKPVSKPNSVCLVRLYLCRIVFFLFYIFRRFTSDLDGRIKCALNIGTSQSIFANQPLSFLTNRFSTRIFHTMYVMLPAILSLCWIFIWIHSPYSMYCSCDQVEGKKKKKP